MIINEIYGCSKENTI